jgi:hypothetical protein
MCWLYWNMGASTSWKPKGLSRPVMGLLYLYLTYRRRRYCPKKESKQRTFIHEVFWSVFSKWMHGLGTVLYRQYKYIMSPNSTWTLIYFPSLRPATFTSSELTPKTPDFNPLLKCQEGPPTLNLYKWSASFRVSPWPPRSALCAKSCLLHADGSS